MGCDSHPCIEVKNSDGQWELQDDKSSWYDIADRENLSYEEREARKPSYLRVLGSRNYLMFACLADVRNGGHGPERFVTPLFGYRGVPDDVSKATMEAIPKDGDYHSHTFFTLEELLNTDWDAVAGDQFERLIYAPYYVAWKEQKIVPDDAPEHMETFTDEFNREVSHEEMLMLLLSNSPDELLKRVPGPFGKKGEKNKTVQSGPHVRVQVPRSYRQCISRFIDTIEDMKKLGDPDKVRVVIAFDN